MKILYVKRRIIEPFWKKIPKMFRQWYYFWGREGFFRASLHYINEVNEVNLNQLEKNADSWLDQYDVVLFHFRCNFRSKLTAFNSLEKWMNDNQEMFAGVKLGLLITNDRAGGIPGDTLLNYYDIVFKREPFEDRSRYDISEANRKKICSTTLSCHLVSATRFNYKDLDVQQSGYSSPPEEYQHDAFFLGKGTSEARKKSVEKLLDTGYDFFGGLQEDKVKLPKRLKTERLGKREYIQTIRKSKINLALEGWGEFTYRHLEIWWACSFMISSPSINDLDLPLEVEDGVHYVTYQSKQDLLDKIDYYLNHPAERKQIALNGRKAFEDGYSFEKHGNYIAQQLGSMV